MTDQITAGSVSLYTVPTDSPEADGTFAWASTSMVLVNLECGSVRATGYTYTQGSANPGLTIQALAARTADYLIGQGDAVFNTDKRDLAEPPFRRDLAPPGTYGRGVPRVK